MSLNGKRDDFVLDDFRACANAVAIMRGRAEAILDEVRTVVSRWRNYAEDAGVLPEQRDKIQNALRLHEFITSG
jgi:serine/threonine-protein kinase HipA